MKKVDIAKSSSDIKLLVSRKEASDRVSARVEKGKEIRKIPFNSIEDYHQAEAEKNKWHRLNIELLTQLFNTDSIAKQYQSSGFLDSFVTPKLHNMRSWYIKSMDKKIKELEFIRERLDLASEFKEVIEQSISSREDSVLGNDILIVPCRDIVAEQSVAKFVKTLDRHPQIVEKGETKGKSIIEKIEEHTNIGYAVVILTPDDFGYFNNEENEQPHIRHSAMFELGFLVGRLGLKRVGALYHGNFSVPSDYHGVDYIEMDERGGWQLKLAMEINNAGIELDLNKLKA